MCRRGYPGAEGMGQTIWHVSNWRNRPGSIRVDYQGRNVVKKLEKGEGSVKENSPDSRIDLETIILAGLERGLNLTDLKKLQLGQVVDFCIEYNNRQARAEKQSERERKQGTRRKATQADINAFFG